MENTDKRACRKDPRARKAIFFSINIWYRFLPMTSLLLSIVLFATPVYAAECSLQCPQSAKKADQELHAMTNALFEVKQVRNHYLLNANQETKALNSERSRMELHEENWRTYCSSGWLRSVHPERCRGITRRMSEIREAIEDREEHIRTLSMEIDRQTREIRDIEHTMNTFTDLIYECGKTCW